MVVAGAVEASGVLSSVVLSQSPRKLTVLVKH